jgi:hypothetical protein
VIVDLAIPPGTSRAQPPRLEQGLPSIEAPGLAYAVLRGPSTVIASFLDGEQCSRFELALPRLDAAFVLKAALCASGLRHRPDRRVSDTVDAVLLAAACLEDEDCVEALRLHRRRSDVRKARRWFEDGFRTPTSIGARRVERHYERDGAGTGGGEWATAVAQRLIGAVEDA